jgi:hypothetical protein
MWHRSTVGSLLILVLSLGLAGCGGGGDEESEAEGGERSAVACSGSPLSSVELPAGFPKPDPVVYTKAETAGPTEIVDGYYDGELRDAYDDYKSGFASAGYDILFDETEEHDSEVSYEGGGRTGQVALRENCEEGDRVSVHITSRPA